MATITCHECGEQYDDQAAFCPGCGYPTPAQLKCTECGAVLTGAESVCRCCGAPIESRAAQAEPISVPMQTPAPAAVTPSVYIGENAKTKFIFLNIYALLALIPTNIIMLGKVFAIKIASKEFDLSVRQFSDTSSEISDIVSKFINIVGSFDAAEQLKNAASIFGTVKYIVYIFMIISALIFVTGWFFIKKDFVPRTALTIPAVYAIGSLILCEVMNRYAFADINNVLSNFEGIKLTMSTTSDFIPMFVFAVIGAILEFAALHSKYQKNNG